MRRGMVGCRQTDIRDVEALASEVGALPKARSLLARYYHAVSWPTRHSAPSGHRLGLYVHGRRIYAAQRDRLGTVVFFSSDGGTVTTNVYGSLTDPAIPGRGPYVGETGPSDA